MLANINEVETRNQIYVGTPIHLTSAVYKLYLGPRGDYVSLALSVFLEAVDKKIYVSGDHIVFWSLVY